MTSHALRSIGVFRCAQRFPYESPRQGVLAPPGEPGRVELDAGLEDAAADLVGFDRVWLVSFLDRAGGWRTRVRPPRHSDRKVGVLGTRSPHRPNPIGISAVRLLAVRGGVLEVAEFDLLDGTPILDVKPYLPWCDSFPDAATGWVGEPGDACRVEFTPAAAARAERVREATELDPVRVACVQLAHEPTDGARKRVAPRDGGGWTFAYRTWRLDFEVEDGRVLVVDVRSGYSSEELADPADPYGDKDVHRAFRAG